MPKTAAPKGYVGRNLKLTEQANKTLNELVEVTGLAEEDILSDAVMSFANGNAEQIANAIMAQAQARIAALTGANITE